MLQKKMQHVWAITWRPGDHTGSFLGKVYRPLGCAVMMVQVSYPREDGRDGIGLFGLAAQADPQSAVISYDDLRLRHDFHRGPFEGARGPVLDPSEDRLGGRGNGSWVQLALEVDQIRARAGTRNFRLPTAPTLPEIYFGYGRKEQARFEVTPALRRRAIATVAASWEADSLEEIGQRQEEVRVQRERAFAELSADAQQERLMAAWDAAFVPPTDPTNSTGLWLLPHELSTNIYTTVRVFEFFGGLAGALAFNPARKLGGKSVRNPAVELAKEEGINLVDDLALLANTTEGSAEFQVIEQRIIGMVPVYRRRLNASAAISDQDLLTALCQYDEPVTIEPTLQALSEGEQVRRMREHLKPHISECCTDEDLLAAARNPNGPLLAAGLCRVQAIHRDVHRPVGIALEFTAGSLGRERIRATLWHGGQPHGDQISSHGARGLAMAA
jgi:hypothetical protein